MAEQNVANVTTRVRFSSPAPDNETRPDPLAYGYSWILCATVGFSRNFTDLCQPNVGLLRYICMPDNTQLDCTDSKPHKLSEPSESEPPFPTSYDWRQSNCDERRSGPCCRKDTVKHSVH